MISFKTKSKKALTLAELLVVLVVVPIVMFACLQTLRPRHIKEDAMLKAGKIIYNQLAIATVDISRKHSRIYSLAQLNTVDGSSRFEITDSGATNKLLALFRAHLKLSRTGSSMAYSGYSGNLKLKNGAFFAIKLYGNCTTTTTTYNPAYGREAMYEYDTCGAIFYDINENELPNTLGVDRYIIAFDKQGLR